MRLSKHEQTAKFIASMRALDGRKNFTDLALKKIKTEFKKLGLSVKTVTVSTSKKSQKKRVDEYTHDASICPASTAKEVIRNYKNALSHCGMMNHEYKKQIEVLKPELVDVFGDSKDVLELSESQDLKRIKSALKRLYRAAKGSRQKKTLLDSVRPEHYAYYKLHGATQFLSTEINKASGLALRKKHDRRIRINPEFIIEKATQVLAKKDATKYERAVALIALTGRRPTEIVKTGRFQKHAESVVMFDGQLKTRDRRLHETIDSYAIPVITDKKGETDLIIKTLRDVQAAFSDVELSYPSVSGDWITSSIGDKKKGAQDIAHNRAVTQAVNTELNAVILNWLDVIGVTCKSLRALYSEIAHERYAPKGHSKSAYAATILGYGNQGFGAALNYEQIEIDRNIERASLPEGETEDSLVDVLNACTEEVESNKRAKASHVLHQKLIAMAANGTLSRDDLTAGRISRIPVNGKRININTVKKYLEIVAQRLNP